MRSARVRGERARRPAGFDLDRHLEQGAMSWPVGRGKVRLRARFDADTAEHLLEAPLSTDQVVRTDRRGRVTVEAGVLDNAELRWWLLGFGAKVEVLGPPRLRADIASTARALAELYR